MGDTSYQPPAGFADDKKAPLIDLDLTDSTELWLIQWPINQLPDFDGQRVSLKLDGVGRMGTLEGTSGKSYEVVSYKSQGPEATVFLTSESEPKIAGKISRRISLINYPEPGELVRRKDPRLNHSQRSSVTPSRSIRPTKSSISGEGGRINKGPITGFGEASRPPKRKRPENIMSTIYSGKGNSGGHSQETKSKKKRKVEK